MLEDQLVLRIANLTKTLTEHVANLSSLAWNEPRVFPIATVGLPLTMSLSRDVDVTANHQMRKG